MSMKTADKTLDEPDIPVAFAAPVAVDAFPTSIAAAQQSDTAVTLPVMEQKPEVLSDRTIQILQDQGFPRGLAEALSTNTTMFPLRIWVLDNSGSMAATDGARLVETSSKNNLQYVQCTRWHELQETVKYHAEMSALLKAPTIFRLLNDPGRTNGPQQFSIAERGNDMIPQDMAIALKCMQSSPSGLTPLSDHIRDIRQQIVQLQPTLRMNGEKVAVVIATDGLPTSSTYRRRADAETEFVDSLKSLEGLPVWLVIRLCTDDSGVVNFYNDLDAQLEYSLEVLDDFEMEAKEIYRCNKFLNYALPLHRCREMGYHHRIFDFLDERTLSKDELRDLLTLLFGEQRMMGAPSLHSDWNGFCRFVKRVVDREEWQWNPITRRMGPWIDVKKLNKVYGRGGCSIM